jgi:hypothetical protein
MPAPELNGRYEQIVLWTASGYDNYSNPVVDVAQEITVRWEDIRRETTDPKGATVIVDVALFVDRDIPIGSIVWRGELTDLPVSPTELREVIGFEKIPDIKGRISQRTALLRSYGNALPYVGSGS